MSEATDVSSLTLASVAALREPKIVDGPNGRSFLFTPVPGNVPNAPAGFEVKDITLANAAEVLMPKVVLQHVQLQTTFSFVDYVNRFKNANTVLFADIKSNAITAIVDYHTESGTDQDGVKAKLTAHRATLKLPHSLEWDTWNGISGHLKTHVEFATFLEENSIDIISPPGGDLLELCRDLQVLNNVNFGGSVRDGDYTDINYAKQADAASKGGVRLPQSIILSIPVYFGETRVPITAFKRQKIDDGKLWLGWKLMRAENVRQDEFHRIVDAISVGVEHLTTIYGAPH